LIDAFSELVCGDKVHQLGKDRFPVIHALSPFGLIGESSTSGKFQIDKRHFTSKEIIFYEVKALSEINVVTAVDFKHPKKLFSGELALFVGLLVNSFSVTLFAKSDVGMSTISLTAYVLSLVLSFFSFGTWNYIIQCSMVVVLVVLLKKMKAGYGISFVLAVAYGILIDFFNQFVLRLPDTILFNVLYYFFGFCGTAFGTCMLFKSCIPVLPFDTFTRDISVHFSISYRKIRTLFDISCLVFSAVLGLLYIGSFKGIGVGTLINAAFMGMAVSMVSDFLDKRLYFKPFIPWLGKLS
jgi:uncharacterized membrane protein YczE